MPTKLSALPTVTSVGTADVMLVDQSATSKQATVAQVAAAILASPALTGTPTAPTATVGTNTTQVATTAFVLANAPSAPVASVYGRTGAIVATTGDYAVAQVTGAAPLASPTFTGTPAAPTAAVDTSTTQVATTAYVVAQAASATPLIDGTAAVGTSTRYARADHVHPIDTTRAPLASPTFSGTTTIPTASIATHYGTITADTDAATVTMNCATSDAHTLLTTSGIGASRAVNFSGATVGQKFHVEVVQPASGGPCLVIWDAGVRWTTGTAPTLATGGSKADLLVFYCRGTGSYAGTMAIPNY